jgi:recombination protein RecT
MSKEVAVVDQLKSSLKLMEPQFKMALPQHIPVEKFIRVVQTAIQTNKDLVDSDRTSFFAACMKSAADGLIPDGKEAALVTFKTKDGNKQVQYMPMVAGILKKVRNSGELATITSQLVYENDKFSYRVDSDGEHLSHEPNLFGDRGKLIGTYAMAKLKDGSLFLEVMTMEQVEAVKKSSRAAQYGPWAGPFATEMIRKTVLRRLSKRLPLSTDIESTIQVDDNLYEFEQPQALSQTETVQDQPSQKKRSSRMSKLMSQDEAPKAEPKDVTPKPEAEAPQVDTDIV